MTDDDPSQPRPEFDAEIFKMPFDLGGLFSDFGNGEGALIGFALGLAILVFVPALWLLAVLGRIAYRSLQRWFVPALVRWGLIKIEVRRKNDHSAAERFLDTMSDPAWPDHR